MFQTTGPVEYLFAEQANTAQLLGALQTVGKGSVDETEWHRLWNG
ncbi:MAG TPA: hypothetical protein VGI10_18530 [Polyangiaceae bacterium]|jgi:hypothetical protein